MEIAPLQISGGATESIVFSLVPYGELPEGMYRLAIEGMYAEFMLLQSCVRDS